MNPWKPIEEGAKLIIIGEPPPLFEHYIPETEECPGCGQESTTVHNRSFPAGVRLCDCCWFDAISKDETLTEALTSLGLSHKPSKVHGKKAIFNEETGEELGNFSAFEGWDLVHKLRGDR